MPMIMKAKGKSKRLGYRIKDRLLPIECIKRDQRITRKYLPRVQVGKKVNLNNKFLLRQIANKLSTKKEVQIWFRNRLVEYFRMSMIKAVQMLLR